MASPGPSARWSARSARKTRATKTRATKTRATKASSRKPRSKHYQGEDSFYLVSGRLAMRCGEQRFTVSPGGYVALPHGVPHTFRVVGDEPAVMLQVHEDDSFLRFIRAVGRPAADRTLPPAGPPTDLDAAFQVAAGTGQPVIGPPVSEEEAVLIAAGPAV